MDETLVYLAWKETGDYYHTHALVYAGTNRERAESLLKSENLWNYMEIWCGDECVETVGFRCVKE